MLPYFIFLFLVLVLAALAYKEQRRNYFLIFTLYLVCSLFAGGRSIQVGTDTGNYARSFENRSYLYREIDPGLSGLGEEPGYYFLQKGLGLISDDYFVLLTGIALVFCFFVFLSISKYSKLPALSLFVFITLGYYTFVFNAARQGIAMAIYMLSIPTLFEKNFWKYSIVVLCAALFHKTIIIALPLYFIFSMRFSLRSLFIVLTGGIIVGLLLPLLLDYGASLETRYELYAENEATGGYLLTVFYVALALFFLYQRQFIYQDVIEQYDVFLHMLLIGSTIYLIVTLTGAYVELTRFAAYFQISTVFLWPMIIRDSTRPFKGMWLVVALIGHLGYFYIFLSQMASLVPYSLNPDVLNAIS